MTKQPVLCINASDGEEEYIKPEDDAMCLHEYCLWVHSIGAQYKAYKATAYTQDDLDAMHADKELMRDEFHVYTTD